MVREETGLNVPAWSGDFSTLVKNRIQRHFLIMGKQSGNFHIKMDVLSIREWWITPNIFAKKQETTGGNEDPPGQGILC